MNKYIIFASIGFELVGLIIGCFYLGQYLDKTFQTKGLIFVALVFVSLIGWLWRVIWLLRRIQKSEEEADSDKSEK